MMSAFKPITLITGTTPTAAGMIALGSILGNEAAKYGYRDFKAPCCSSSPFSWRYIDHGSVKLHGRTWKYDVKGVQALVFNFK